MIQNKCMNVWKNARLEFSVKFSYNFLSRRKWAIPNLHKEYILVEVGKSIRTTVCMRQLECCVNCEKAIPIPVSYSNCNNENTQMPSLLRQSFVDRKLTMIQFSRSSERDKTSIHSTHSMHVYSKVWVAIVNYVFHIDSERHNDEMDGNSTSNRENKWSAYCVKDCMRHSLPRKCWGAS